MAVVKAFFQGLIFSLSLNYYLTIALNTGLAVNFTLFQAYLVHVEAPRHNREELKQDIVSACLQL